MSLGMPDPPASLDGQFAEDTAFGPVSHAPAVCMGSSQLDRVTIIKLMIQGVVA
jgi:hypothetical protein